VQSGCGAALGKTDSTFEKLTDNQFKDWQHNSIKTWTIQRRF